MTETPEEKIVQREIDTDTDNPAAELAETVAELEDEETTNLPTMYECVDGVLDNIFSTPPASEAQMQIEFSYQIYRVTIEQNGTATFVKTE